MSNTDIKIEVLLVGKYCEIIKGILNVHKHLSVNKTMFFAYLLKIKNNYCQWPFKSNTSKDTVFKVISLISGNYSDYCANIKYIIEAMHLLIENGDVVIQDTVLLRKDGEIGAEFYDDKLIKNAIEESRNFSDRQFLKEVLSNV